jgi:hypothetical protein
MLNKLANLDLGWKDRFALDVSIIFAALVSLAILLMGTHLSAFVLDPGDGTGFHYDWQLLDPSAWGRITIWLGFGLHQLAVWWTIYYAQKNYHKYTDKLRPVNYWALGINAAFVLLHYAQTYFFYDAIAQDIPSWTAQFAVIMMLVVILALENQRRGFMFGKKFPFKQEFIRWLKEYHGYAFSFAIIYTFWFHPMVPTAGHIFGFFYTILVMVQGSLMFTRVHLDTNWKFLLEILVLPHAIAIAWFQGPALVAMFGFGFMVLFLCTQMHGLKLPLWAKSAFTISFLLMVAFTYFVAREPSMINEVIRVPMIEYLSIIAIYGVWLGVTWVIKRFQGSTPQVASGD